MIKYVFLLAFITISVSELHSCDNKKKTQVSGFFQYYSQYGQDKFLNEEVFLHKKNGFFIEIGAHDGISLSNTYFFEKNLEWHGICIEPYPAKFAELCKNRSSHTICLPFAIDNNEGSADFLKIEGYSEMLSGLLDKYDPAHLKRIDYELSMHGGQKKLISVPVFRLQTVLDQNQVSHVDLLSVDTEGSELEILRSIDFDRVKIDVIVVENNHKSEQINNFLASKDYSKIFSLGVDEIYISNTVETK